MRKYTEGMCPCIPDTTGGKKKPNDTSVPLSRERGLGTNQYETTLYPLKTNGNVYIGGSRGLEGLPLLFNLIPYVQHKCRMQKPGLLDFSRSNSGLVMGREVIAGESLLQNFGRNCRSLSKL